MKTRSMIGLLAVGAVMWAGCADETDRETTATPPASGAAEEGEAQDEGVVRLSEAAIARAGLQIVAVQSVALADVVEVNGRVELNADRTVRVAAFVEGVVRECCKSVGTYVRKDETLAVLHSHQTHALLAEYRQAQAEIDARRAELDFARQSNNRASRLHKLKAGPLAEVERTEAALSRAEKAVTAAEAVLVGARAHFEYLGVAPPGQAPAAAEHLEVNIRSPLAGTVVDRSVTPGGVLAAGDELYVVSDLSRVWVIAQVPEERLGAISTGMKVQVRVRAYPDRVFAGRVTRIGARLDPDTRMAAVRCSLANPGGVLKAGMYATISLHSRARRTALVIPVEALQRLDDQALVFVSEGAGRFRVRAVETGSESAGRVEVLEGLTEGERVAAHGSFLLKAESLRNRMGEE